MSGGSFDQTGHSLVGVGGYLSLTHMCMHPAAETGEGSDKITEKGKLT